MASVAAGALMLALPHHAAAAAVQPPFTPPNPCVVTGTAPGKTITCTGDLSMGVITVTDSLSLPDTYSVLDIHSLSTDAGDVTFLTASNAALDVNLGDRKSGGLLVLGQNEVIIEVTGSAAASINSINVWSSILGSFPVESNTTVTISNDVDIIKGDYLGGGINVARSDKFTNIDVTNHGDILIDYGEPIKLLGDYEATDVNLINTGAVINGNIAIMEDALIWITGRDITVNKDIKKNNPGQAFGPMTGSVSFGAISAQGSRNVSVYNYATIGEADFAFAMPRGIDASNGWGDTGGGGEVRVTNEGDIFAWDTGLQVGSTGSLAVNNSGNISYPCTVQDGV